ncbi:DUF6391 domain-containing protein [Aphanothece sacrum]|uniref:Uncharacterized protein n=1 Tax=Aphanothece sacrum FPU1 TaxID=1920663 RepID=A0A401ICC8_APHSA|nr:DUF6391 domain-containing protein [Aphanothece sacrum]GBF78880.1 hypothetical protein AsFPU1_0270 [Aphanothece sacrum FPU1]GBF83111.1 hypothetical protein AsFPU3_0149 [Aphanothece sacrum FPU3]
MTTSTNVALDNLWDFDIWKPQPTQDTELLKQIGFIPGLKELLMLRQVHALEHATVWVLSEMAQRSTFDGFNSSNQADNETLGGLSTEKGFYLYGQVNHPDLQKAVKQALERFNRGEWNLAVHPRCGTNLSVTMLLTTGLALGTSLLLPRGPIEQILGLAVATTAAAQLAPDLGQSVQKYLTTAIPFNLELTNISKTQDFWGHPAHFVSVTWRDLQ